MKNDPRKEFFLRKYEKTIGNIMFEIPSEILHKYKTKMNINYEN